MINIDVPHDHDTWNYLLVDGVVERTEIIRATKTAEEVPVSTRARNTIVGNYQWIGTNHQRLVYRRIPDVYGLSVNIYFWDGSHGKSWLHGWWFGFTVGGNQVWAQHPDHESWYPPQTGWKMTCDSAMDAEIAIEWGDNNSGKLRVVTHTANCSDTTCSAATCR